MQFAKLFRTAVRHTLMRVGLESVLIAYWKRQGRPIKGGRRERFAEIYRIGYWGRGDMESLSGEGSTLAATSTVRGRLRDALVNLKAQSLLDVGCGDFNWMGKVDLPCKYIGIDIVPEVVAQVIERYGADDRTFLCLDAVTDRIPPADVVLCREVLFHLSFHDALKLIKNIRMSGARYLMATSDPSTARNTDIPTGAYRDINLERRPYDLGPCESMIPDGDGPNPDRVLGIWRL